MQVRVLGSVDVVVNGAPRTVSGLRRKAVLAALAMNAGQIVSADRLIEIVWGGQAPATAANTLQSHISYLRRVLGDPSAIATRPPGYALVAPDASDVVTAERLIREGTASTIAAQAVAALRSAADLWRGAALADLDRLPWFAQQAERLRQLRLQARQALVHHRLALGEHADVLAELEDLSREQPLDEQIHGHLMLALYRVGRQADALAVFQRLRAVLDEELGIGPSPALRDLEAAILRHDPGLYVTVPAAQMPTPVPAQLPPSVAAFTGRERELSELDGLLAEMEPDTDSGPPAVVISAVSGTAGVGKTALAVHWAHRVADRFPDGQLYVNLRGFDPGGTVVEPAEAIRGFLEALGVPADRIPLDLAAQTGLYRSLLAGKRILVMIDNARDVEQVRPLLPGAPGCLAMVTSRNQLTSLVAIEGAHPLTVELLSTEEAHEFLARRLGGERIGAEPEAAQEIITRCARLPLALAIACAHAAAQPDAPLAKLAGELSNTGDALDAFAGGDPATDLRRVFSWSYRRLDGETARLFRLLGLHPGPCIGMGAAASLAGVPVDRVRPVLTALTGAHLLAEAAGGRYALHDLLRAYARELADTTDPQTDRAAALGRMLDHYLRTGYRAASLAYPRRERISLPEPQPGAMWHDPPDRCRALDWLQAEYAVLMAAVDRASAAGFDVHAWQLAMVLWDFQDRHGRWQDLQDAMRIALPAAERLGDRAAQACVHRLAAIASRRLGYADEAQRHLDNALALYRALGDCGGQAETLFSMCVVFDQQGRYAQAMRLAEQALELYSAAGNLTGQAKALNAVGWCHARLGDYERTIALSQRAVNIHRAMGNLDGEAYSCDSLGYASHHLGDHDGALAHYRRALRLFREGNHRYGEAHVLTHIGQTHRAAGDHGEARRAWRGALAILREVGHPHAVAVQAELDALASAPATARAGRWRRRVLL